MKKKKLKKPIKAVLELIIIAILGVSIGVGAVCAMALNASDRLDSYAMGEVKPW